MWKEMPNHYDDAHVDCNTSDEDPKGTFRHRNTWSQAYKIHLCGHITLLPSANLHFQ